MAFRIPNRRAPLVVAGLAAALVLAGCGGKDSPSAGTATTADSKASGYNAADVTFATDMISHHRQAVDMAEMVLMRGESAKVKELATRIKAEQSPEIDKLAGFLTSFGKPVPAAGNGGASAMHHGGMAAGMMTDAEMTKLHGLSGTALDRAFLTDMTEHHTGAVKMSKTELADGKYASAKELATSIVSAQTAEIAEMKQLLGGA